MKQLNVNISSVRGNSGIKSMHRQVQKEFKGEKDHVLQWSGNHMEILFEMHPECLKRGREWRKTFLEAIKS